MSKFNRHGWDSDFSPKNFTSDGIDRFIDDRRDELNGRRDAGGRPGKTIHEHKVIRETPREFSDDELFQTLLAAAKRGDLQCQYRAGLKYLENGDMANAKYWLTKAADYGWPDAVAKLKQLRELEKGKTTCCNPNPKIQAISMSPGMGSWVKRFDIVEFVAEDGVRKYVLLLRMSDEPSPVARSKVLSTRGLPPSSDVFSTYAAAREAGLRCLRDWGRRKLGDGKKDPSV